MKAKLASCPTIAIRADGSRSVGMGHVMRTLSIAEALRVAGAHVLYVCADKQPKEIIESRGFEVLVLETDPANLMGEFQRLSLVLRDIDAQFVFVDSFDATDSYFESVRALCPVGSFAFGRKFTRGLDLVVSYLPSSDEQWLKDRFGRDGIALLFGARYVPARREFLDMNKRSFANYVKSVLIVAGGSDQLGMCARILEKLQGDSFWSAIEKHVVVGPTSGCRNKVLSLAEDDASVFVHLCRNATSRSRHAVIRSTNLRYAGYPWSHTQHRPIRPRTVLCPASWNSLETSGPIWMLARIKYAHLRIALWSTHRGAPPRSAQLLLWGLTAGAQSALRSRFSTLRKGGPSE